MKWIITTLVVLLSLNAHAARFYTPSGKIIMKGDSVGKLIMHAGNPYRRRSQVICVDQKRDYCRRWGRAEYWYYQDIREEKVFWTITIMGEKIVNMKWSR